MKVKKFEQMYEDNPCMGCNWETEKGIW